MADRKPIIPPADRKPIVSPSPVVRVGREPGKTLGGFTKTVYKPNIKNIQAKTPSASSSEPKIDVIKQAQIEEHKRIQREERAAQMNQPRQPKREPSSSSEDSKPLSLSSYRPFDPKPENNRLDIHEIDDTDDFMRRPVSLPFPYMSPDEGKADEAELAAQRLASGLNVKSDAMDGQEDLVKPIAPRRKVATAVRRQTRDDTILSPFTFEPTSAAHILQGVMERDEMQPAPVFIQLPSHLPYRPPPPEKPAPGAKSGKATAVDIKKEEKKVVTDGSHTDAEDEDEDMARMTPEERAKHLAAKAKRNRYDRLYSKSADHSINNLPAGQMGKLVVYKSGRVELHCGSVRIDVAKGTNPMCYQEVVSLEPERGEAFQMGALEYRLSCMIQEGSDPRHFEARS